MRKADTAVLSVIVVDTLYSRLNRCILLYIVGPVAQSVWRLSTARTVRDRIPAGTRFSALPDRPWGPPSLL